MNRGLALKFGPWIVVGVALLFLTGLVVLRLNAPADASRQAGPAPAIGGTFQLVDQTGRAVDQGILKGKWSAIFFGYTYCPDVCPTTLQTLAVAHDLLGPRARNFQVIFITVDPRRDTSAQLSDYLSGTAFGRGVIGLTGTEQQIATVASRYGVYFQRAGGGDNYGVDHSSAIYLMGPDGRFDRAIPYGLTPQLTRDHITRAMSEAARRGA